MTEKSEAERNLKLLKINESDMHSIEQKKNLLSKCQKKTESIRSGDEEKEKRHRKKELIGKGKINKELTEKIKNKNQIKIRMSRSINNNANCSDSDKYSTKTSHERRPSSCDVEKILTCASRSRKHSSQSICIAKNKLKIPEGFMEIGGHLIPSNTRHAGCFIPSKESGYRVKGVLAWGPPPNLECETRMSVTLWASLDHRSELQPHRRAISAHSSNIGSRRINYSESTALKLKNKSECRNYESGTLGSTHNSTKKSILVKKQKDSCMPKSRNITESVKTESKNLKSRKAECAVSNVNDNSTNFNQNTELKEAEEEHGKIQAIVENCVSNEAVRSNDTTEIHNEINGFLRNNKNITEISVDNPEINSGLVSEEEMAYKTRLKEQRRLAREKKEEQRRINMEICLKVTEDEKKIEDESEKISLIDNESSSNLEKKMSIYETERHKKGELQREFEENQLEKIRLEEEARMDRKRRIEKVLSRVKRPDDTFSLFNEEIINVDEALAVTDNMEEKNEIIKINVLKENDSDILGESGCPTYTNLSTNENYNNAKEEKSSSNNTQLNHKLSENYPCKIENEEEFSNNSQLNGDLKEINAFSNNNDSGAYESDPKNNLSCESHSIPLCQTSNETTLGDLKFKSRILQSMLGQGRLNSISAQDSILTDPKRNSVQIPPLSHVDISLPRRQSYQSNMDCFDSSLISTNDIIKNVSLESLSEDRLINNNEFPRPKYNELTVYNLNSTYTDHHLEMDKIELCSETV